jgi:NTE family protein
MPPRSDRSAIVLSAGGVRGAYQVGVIDGIVDVLGCRGAAGPPLFNLFSGTSIGSINAAYLAANADRADHAIGGLAEIWSQLDPEETLRFSPLSLLWGWPRWRVPGRSEPDCESGYVGRSLLDPRPIQALLERAIDWGRLHANIRASLVRALVIAALDIFEGRTTLFAELAPGLPFRPYPYPPHTLLTPVTTDHVLASTALPIVFPARSIGGRYYMDGGVRFSTPITPALRANADRVLVISLLYQPPGPEPENTLHYPGIAFLLGHIFSTLLLDPVLPNLENLRQTNRILDILAETLDPPARADVTRNLERSHILPSHTVPTLVFRPSENLALLTSAFLREELDRGRLSPIWRAILRAVKCGQADHQALLASLLLLDGRLAARLIELGRRDAHAAKDRILEFFER